MSSALAKALQLIATTDAPATLLAQINEAVGEYEAKQRNDVLDEVLALLSKNVFRSSLILRASLVARLQEMKTEEAP